MKKGSRPTTIRPSSCEDIARGLLGCMPSIVGASRIRPVARRGRIEFICKESGRVS